MLKCKYMCFSFHNQPCHICDQEIGVDCWHQVKEDILNGNIGSFYKWILALRFAEADDVF